MLTFIINPLRACAKPLAYCYIDIAYRLSIEQIHALGDIRQQVLNNGVLSRVVGRFLTSLGLLLYKIGAHNESSYKT